jgi:hypothetical protein
MLGEDGAKFYALLQELSELPAFVATTQTLALQDVELKGNEELVLRFFAAKNSRDTFRGNVRDWLDGFMESILLKTVAFDSEAEKQIFYDVFSEIETKLGESAFVKFRGESPIGGLAPAYFEGIAIGCFNALDDLKMKEPVDARNAITQLVQSDLFRAVTGPGANNKTKLESRISLAAQAIIDA